MKRVISLVIALSMFLTLGVGTSFAAGQTGFADVDGTGYETPVGILGALNIMGGYTDGSFHPYSTMTRAEMAAVSVRLRGVTDYGDVVSLDDVQYKDMDGHPLAAAVAYARSMGIVDGYSDGYFYPDDPVTYEQAVKMILGALGYDYYSIAKGGYPAGYLQVASELKLTSGVGLTVGSYITRGDVAKIVYNALTVDMMTATSYGDGTSDVTYEIVEGKNILNTYFDVEEISGIVEENSSTAIDGETTIDKDEVRIGDEVFNIGDTNIDEYLGYYVTFYAIESEYSDKRVIISYKVESSKNEYLKINAEYIDDVELTSSRYIIHYWRNDREKNTHQAKISLTPVVIYNGVAVTDFTLADFNPEYGQVTLVDNDRDGVYDMVDILSYEILTVLTSSAASGSVNAYPTFTTGLRSVKLIEDEDEDYKVKLVDGSGTPVTFNMIDKNSVLNVAVSKDKDSLVRTAIVSNDKVEGTIRSVNDAGQYVINGKGYDVVSYIEESGELSVGDSGTFFLTYDGRIAGYDAEQKVTRNIGMFIAYKSGSMSEGGDMIKILKSDGTIAIYNLANTVKLNGETMSGSNLFSLISDPTNPLFGRRDTESSRLSREVPDPARCGILYKLNSSGNISEITMNATGATVSAATTDTGYGNNDIRCVVKRGKTSSDGTGDSLYYSTAYRCFHRSDNRVYVTDNTILMWSQEGVNKSEGSSFWVSRPSQLRDNDSAAYWFEGYFYFMGDKPTADFVVFYDGPDAVGGSSANTNFNENCYWDGIKIVDRVIEKYENGETVYQLAYYEGGTLQYADFNSEYDNVWYRDGNSTFWRRGDIIRFVRVDNKIAAVQSIFYNDAWNNPTGNELDGGKNPDHRYIFPMGRYEFWGQDPWNHSGNNIVQRYFVGRVENIQNMTYFSTMDINVGGNNLVAEPIGGNCYRLDYDSRGYISGIENVGSGAISEGQLVLARQNGTNAQISCRVQETYILYEYEDIAESSELRRAYRTIYPDNEWVNTLDWEDDSVYYEDVEATDLSAE